MSFNVVFKCLGELCSIKERENRIKDGEECVIPMGHLQCDILRFSDPESQS